MTSNSYNIAVCVSGGGRSLQNLLDSQSGSTWNVACVVSSSETCPANEIAHKHQLPLFVGNFSKSNHDTLNPQLFSFLVRNNVSLVVLAGFLKLFPVYDEFKRRTINIHPALLPKFGGKGMHGLNVHRAVIEKKENVSGATVHFVSEQYDEGQIISQVEVPIITGDTPEILAQRVFKGECALLPQTIQKLADTILPLPSGKIWKMEFNK